LHMAQNLAKQKFGCARLLAIFLEPGCR